ncbi:MAG: class I SAM-dependent methyltransferase [Planctomycetes bacterium]|nr:class I SAM-dependent methyltransferase [Planctomycetota bacterium]
MLENDTEMKVFDNYARYYDLLYRDKDYQAEADYVVSLLNEFAGPAKSVLELGCGTGKHAISLAKRGLEITGVDLSSEMVSQAKQRAEQSGQPVASQLDFSVADIRNLSLGKKVDAVISLFHVLSYQTANDDITAVFSVAREHLNPDGVFIFDFWYGPAVLTERPEIRTKKLADETIEAERIARPEMFPNENCVEVNYDLTIRNKVSGEIETFQECHRMRYLFLPEVRQFLLAVGMEMVFARQWAGKKEPGFDTWGVCCGAKLIG